MCPWFQTGACSAVQAGVGAEEGPVRTEQHAGAMSGSRRAVDSTRCSDRGANAKAGPLGTQSGSGPTNNASPRHKPSAEGAWWPWVFPEQLASWRRKRSGGHLDQNRARGLGPTALWAARICGEVLGTRRRRREARWQLRLRCRQALGRLRQEGPQTHPSTGNSMP